MTFDRRLAVGSPTRLGFFSLPLLGLMALILFIIIKFVVVIINPALVITSPNSELTRQQEIALAGRIDPQAELRINGELITPTAEGTFQRPALLREGLNTFQFEVKNFWGVVKTKTIKLKYQP